MARVFDQLYAAARFLNPGILTDREWDRVIADLDARLATLEGNEARIAAALDALVALGLTRINEVLVPAFQKIQNLTELGFLTATSATPLTLTLGAQRLFVIPVGPARELFTPSAFVAITRVATTADYAIARVVGYAAAYGELTVEIVSVAGSPGPHSDWEIAATAGSVVAMIAMLAEARTARDAAVPAATAATTQAGLATVGAETATTQAGIATTKAAAAAASAAAAAQFDPTGLVRRDGTTPFTAVQHGVTRPAGDASTALATTAFVAGEVEDALGFALCAAHTL